jgi:hypothetical protein
MKMTLKIASGLSLLVLAACTQSGAPSAPATPAAPQQQAAAPRVDADAITGNWCSAAGGRFAISETRFDSAENQCAVTRLNNFQGTYTAALECSGEGMQSSENITMTPVRDELHISFLQRASQRTIARRC